MNVSGSTPVGDSVFFFLSNMTWRTRISDIPFIQNFVFKIACLLYFYVLDVCFRREGELLSRHKDVKKISELIYLELTVRNFLPSTGIALATVSLISLWKIPKNKRRNRTTELQPSNQIPFIWMVTLLDSSTNSKVITVSFIIRLHVIFLSKDKEHAKCGGTLTDRKIM